MNVDVCVCGEGQAHLGLTRCGRSTHQDSQVGIYNPIYLPFCRHINRGPSCCQWRIVVYHILLHNVIVNMPAWLHFGSGLLAEGSSRYVVKC